MLLRQAFFSGKDTVKIAKRLLGKFLVRRYRGKTKKYLIVETEAYNGFKDKASHAHKGKTERNKIMFGPTGHWYVYFTYGMHWMLNIVTRPINYPAAILIRGISKNQRSYPRQSASILNGPAKLTKALHIDKNLNGKPVAKKSGLWLEDRGIKIPPNKIKKARGMGVVYAGRVWAKKCYRFYID